MLCFILTVRYYYYYFLSPRRLLMSYKPFRGLTLALSILIDLITSDNKPSYYVNKLPRCLTNDGQMNRSDSVGVFVRASCWPVAHSNHVHMGDESSAETFKIKLMVIDKKCRCSGSPERAASLSGINVKTLLTFVQSSSAVKCQKNMKMTNLRFFPSLLVC